jgi:D-alanyl-D-alanine-carboxypeptidase/D-alanyl-D-alanine-endopeptidase
MSVMSTLTRALIALVVLVVASSAQLIPAERIDEVAAAALRHEFLMGAAVGQLGPEGELLHGLGRMGVDDSRRPDGDSVFEIGSISKVFTGLLLADAVVRGEVELDMPVAELLPDDVELGVNGRPMTLQDLSTHVSGLPRMPGNFIPINLLNPYKGYDNARMFAYIDGFDPERAPEDEWEYSNLAVGLLGQLLAARAETDYPTLLRERILDPLGMADTAVAPDEHFGERLAAPHDFDGEPAGTWDLEAMEAAGGIRSSARDMMRFGSFCLGELEPSGSETLREALELSMIPRCPTDDDGKYFMGLGWMINVDLGIWWHNGATGGYHAMFEVLPDEGRAVVALGNMSGGTVGQLADRMVVEWVGEGEYQIDVPTQVTLAPAELDALVGNYHSPATGVLVVEREGDKLYGRMSIQPRYRLWPESARRVHFRVAEAALEFDEGVPCERVVLHQMGAVMPLERMPDEAENEG